MLADRLPVWRLSDAAALAGIALRSVPELQAQACQEPTQFHHRARKRADLIRERLIVLG
jgi:hypothetical protein